MKYAIGSLVVLSPKTSNRDGKSQTDLSIGIMDIDSKGDGDILKLKANIANIEHWQKFKGQEIIVEIKQWFMNGKTGLCLVDKDALPTLRTSNKSLAPV